MKQSLLFIYILLLFTITACQTFKKVSDHSTTTTQKQGEPTLVRQASAPVISEPIALTVGNKEFKTNDLKIAIDQLTVGDSINGKVALDQIILNRRMLLEAQRLGYDKSEDFVGELTSYRDLLAQSYTTDSTIIKYLLKETYDWMKQEVRVAHIMYSLPEFAEPSDTMAIYQKLIDIRNKALAGEDFSKLASIYSQDKKTNTNGGNIGWFTAMQLVYPLEKAAYNTPIGNISMPVRTKGGYHIIKVFEKRPYSGEVQVQHLVKFIYPSSPDSLKAKAKIDSLYEAIKKGANFEELCQKYSDDVSTKNYGGFLPKFSVGKREEAFEKAAFTLNEGEISPPVRTSAGWHILKLFKKFPLESFDKISLKLKEKVVTDSRGEVVRDNTVAKIKAQYNFNENTLIVKNAFARADTNLLKKKWNYSPTDTLLSQTLFNLDNQSFKVKDFFDYVLDKHKVGRVPAGYTPKMLMRSLYKSYVDFTVTAYAEKHLEERIPEFNVLMDEYRSSFLTMQLMNERVYEKSVEDTLGQRKYYEQNAAKFTMPERASATIVATTDTKLLQQLNAIITKGTPYPLNRSTKNPIYFNKSMTDLTVEHKNFLAGLLVTMKKNPDYVVEVGSHADVNEADITSAERLKNVVKFLMDNGLPLTRIIENDYVKTKLQSKFDWSKNSRVSFIFFSNSKNDLEKLFNKKNPNAISINDGLFKRGENKYLDAVKWNAGKQTLQMDGKTIEITIDKIEPVRNKTLREARGEVIKNYQILLEKQFKDELSNKYPVKMNDEEVKRLLESPKRP